MVTLRRLGIAGLALAVLAALGALSLQPREQVTAETPDNTRTISVSGSARIETAPDMARVQFGVEGQATTAQEAMARTSTTMNAVVTAVRQAGIPEDDIKTTSVGLFPLYARPDPSRPEGQTITGYRASNYIQVTVNDLGKVVWVLDGAVAAGANRVNGISFGLKNNDELQRKALADAVRNARAKADVLASAAGASVVAVRSISESGGYWPGPMPIGKGGDAAPGMSVPVEPGTLTFTVNVSAQFIIG